MTKKSTNKQLTKQYPLQYGVGNPTLRTICQHVDTLDKDVIEFCIALGELMREYEGVGISAPQIGVEKRIISVTHRKSSRRGSKCRGQSIMINPQIIKKSDKMVASEEGCLSLPGQYGKVMRHETIVVHFTNIEGEEEEMRLKGFNAAIVQHEVDHLDGVLFVDKLIG